MTMLKKIGFWVSISFGFRSDPKPTVSLGSKVFVPLRKRKGSDLTKKILNFEYNSLNSI